MIDIEMAQATADRQAITDIIYRSCRSMDRIDRELGYSIWHDDAVVDNGEESFRGPARQFIDWVCAQHEKLLFHSHQVSNIVIDLDGDHASSGAYVTATLRMREGETLRQWMVWGRYSDRWSRRNGHWGIDGRVYLHDFDEVREIGSQAKVSTGRRDRSDDLYTVLTAHLGPTSP